MANPSNQPVERDDSFKLLDFSLPPINLSVSPSWRNPNAKGPCNQLAAVVPNGYTTKAVKPVVAGSETAWGGWSDQIRN